MPLAYALMKLLTTGYDLVWNKGSRLSSSTVSRPSPSPIVTNNSLGRWDTQRCGWRLWTVPPSSGPSASEMNLAQRGIRHKNDRWPSYHQGMGANTRDSGLCFLMLRSRNVPLWTGPILFTTGHNGEQGKLSLSRISRAGHATNQGLNAPRKWHLYSPGSDGRLKTTSKTVTWNPLISGRPLSQWPAVLHSHAQDCTRNRWNLLNYSTIAPFAEY